MTTTMDTTCKCSCPPLSSSFQRQTRSVAQTTRSSRAFGTTATSASSAVSAPRHGPLGRLGLTAPCFPDHFYSKNVDHTFDSDIMQYVTHDQCRAANELGLTLSIHMVKRRALSDPSNLETVRMLCETYPRMKVILCHSAR